jgi:hypothetical protein
VDNNYLDLGMNKSGFVHTLPSGRLTPQCVDVLMASHAAELKLMELLSIKKQKKSTPSLLSPRV